MALRNEIAKTPEFSNLKKRYLEDVPMAMNKSIFEENWKVIRAQTTERWSLMADFDLLKVDKADDKYDRFITMLQTKYGYTRQQAREEFNKFWSAFEVKSRNSS